MSDEDSYNRISEPSYSRFTHMRSYHFSPHSVHHFSPSSTGGRVPFWSSSRDIDYYSYDSGYDHFSHVVLRKRFISRIGDVDDSAIEFSSPEINTMVNS